MKNSNLIRCIYFVFFELVCFFACTLKTKTPAPVCLCPEYPIFPTVFNFISVCHPLLQNGSEKINQSLLIRFSTIT